MKQEIGRNRSGLRLGYTTGSCAAAAAKAAVAMLLKEEEITSCETDHSERDRAVFGSRVNDQNCGLCAVRC